MDYSRFQCGVVLTAAIPERWHDVVPGFLVHWKNHAEVLEKIEERQKHVCMAVDADKLDVSALPFLLILEDVECPRAAVLRELGIVILRAEPRDFRGKKTIHIVGRNVWVD